ncbi:MAG TPA: hypothetical protein VFW33_10685 [Gemmataceae bacterium]|nr:hypothetical protein [Gemmataceae bacterium]
MSQPPSASTAVRGRLRELAVLVRNADYLDPQARQSLADLADQMADRLRHPHPVTAEEVELGQLAGELIAALHREEGEAPVAARRNRLEEAVIAAETRAPLVAETARELIDVIANLGI